MIGPKATREILGVGNAVFCMPPVAGPSCQAGTAFTDDEWYKHRWENETEMCGFKNPRNVGEQYVLTKQMNCCPSTGCMKLQGSSRLFFC